MTHRTRRRPLPGCSTFPILLLALLALIAPILPAHARSTYWDQVTFNDWFRMRQTGTPPLAETGYARFYLDMAGQLWVSVSGGAYQPLIGGGGGGGTGVTSIALAVPTWLSVAGSPLTTPGTITVSTTSQAARQFLASPSASTGVLVPRGIVLADLPAMDLSHLPVVDVVHGGTNATTPSGARTSLGLSIGTDVPSPTGTGASGTWAISVTGNAGTATNGLVSTGSYADPSWLTSLVATKVTGALPASHGGTGITSPTSGTILVGNGTGYDLYTIGAGLALDLTGHVLSATGGGGGGGGMGGSGSTNTIPLFSSATVLANSPMTVSGSNVAASGNLSIAGTITAGSGPTTLTSSAGQLLLGALPALDMAHGGSGLTSFTPNGLFVANSGGTAMTQATIGSGLSLSGGTLTATGGSSGSVATSTGTVSTLPMYSGASAITNSPVTMTSSMVNIPGALRASELATAPGSAAAAASLWVDQTTHMLNLNENGSRDLPVAAMGMSDVRRYGVKGDGKAATFTVANNATTLSSSTFKGTPSGAQIMVQSALAATLTNISNGPSLDQIQVGSQTSGCVTTGAGQIAPVDVRPLYGDTNGEWIVVPYSGTTGSPLVTQAAEVMVQGLPPCYQSDVQLLRLKNALPSGAIPTGTATIYRTLTTTISVSGTTATLAAAIHTPNAASVSAYTEWGSNDTSNVATALAAIRAAGGSTFYFPAGRYNCRGITLKSGESIIGDGPSTQLVPLDVGQRGFDGDNPVIVTDAGTCTSSSHCKDISVRSLFIDGKSSGYHTVRIEYTDDALLFGLSVIGGGGISDGAAVTVYFCQRAVVSHCTMDYSIRGISFDRSDHSIMLRDKCAHGWTWPTLQVFGVDATADDDMVAFCTVDHGQWNRGFGHGVLQFYGTRDSKAIGNLITNTHQSSQGYEMEPLRFRNCSNPMAIGNTIYKGSFDTGISVWNVDDKHYDTNAFDNGGGDPTPPAVIPVGGGVIAGNLIVGSCGYGVDVEWASSTATFAPLGMVIQGNVFRDFVDSPVLSYSPAGIHIDAPGCLITGNYSQDILGGGLVLDASARTCLVQGNSFRNLGGSTKGSIWNGIGITLLPGSARNIIETNLTFAGDGSGTTPSGAIASEANTTTTTGVYVSSTATAQIQGNLAYGQTGALLANQVTFASSDPATNNLIGVSVGGGQGLKRVLQAAAVLSFASHGSGPTSDELTISIPGARIGDPVALSAPSTQASLTSYTARVTAAGVVTVRRIFFGTGAVAAESGSFSATVSQF